MADDDQTTQTAPPPAALPPGMTMDQINALAQQFMPQMPTRDTTPVNRSTLSLLGEALSGGPPVGGMTPAEQELAGKHALMNFGTSMLAASGYQPGGSFGTRLAQGLRGAQSGEVGSEELAMAQLGAQQDWALKQQQAHLDALKTALPFLQLGYRQSLPSPFAGNAPGGGGATGGGAALPTIARDTSVGTVGQQANNPGNIMAGGAFKPVGAIGTVPAAGGRQVVAFPDVATGVAAHSDLLNNYAGQGINTIADAVTHWVGDPKADTTSYANDIAARLGVKPTDPIDLTDPKVQSAFIMAQQPHESGKPWLSQGDVDKGIALAQARRQGSGAGKPYQVAGAAVAPPSASAAPAISTSPTLRGPGSPVPSSLPVPPIPPTVTPPATPAPQQVTQADQPPTPPAVTTPPAQPPIDLKSAPDTTLSLEDFTRKHWTPLTPEEVNKYAPGPDNQLARDRAAQVQTAQNNADAARTTLLRIQAGQVPGDINKAMAQVTENNAQLATAEKNYDDAVRSLTTEGARNLATIDNQQKDRLAAQYKASVTEPANAATLAKQQGDQAIALERAKGSTASEEKVMQGLDETFDTAKSAIDQINLTRTLSQASGDPTFVQQLQKTHPDLVRWIANLGGLDDNTVQRLGTAGAMDAAMNKLISMARTGSGFQRMTNLDVQILSSQAPGGTDPQQWREAKLAYLQTYLERQMQYVTAVHELRADGMPLQKARVQAQQQAGSVVPTVPSFTDQPGASASQQRAAWAQKNGVQPGTFVIAPNGQLTIAGQAQRQQQQPQAQPSLVPVN